MRSASILVLATALLFAGCVTQPAAETDALDPAAETELALEPIVQEFRGRMTASPLGAVAHQDPQTEMLFAGVQREGFLLEIVAVPDVLQVDLEWSAATPDPRMFSMVNIPTSTEGEVLDVLSEMTSGGHVCMRVPLDEVQPGLLSVMAHSAGAVALDYTVRITTIGGEAILHADRGHMEVEREAGAEREPLPCPAEA